MQTVQETIEEFLSGTKNFYKKYTNFVISKFAKYRRFLSYDYKSKEFVKVFFKFHIVTYKLVKGKLMDKIANACSSSSRFAHIVHTYLNRIDYFKSQIVLGT